MTLTPYSSSSPRQADCTTVSISSAVCVMGEGLGILGLHLNGPNCLGYLPPNPADDAEFRGIGEVEEGGTGIGSPVELMQVTVVQVCYLQVDSFPPPRLLA